MLAPLGGPDLPDSDMHVVDPALLDTGPMRLALDEPVYSAGPFDQSCNACHSKVEPRDRRAGERMIQHTELHHDHGANNRCFNCHDTEQRNLLRLYTGEQIEFNDAVRLCAQCHGPVYRDWQRGAHGKTTQSWLPGQGVRLNCVDCHDPHAPAFGQMDLLAGPSTWRMGEVDAHDATHDEEHE